MIIKLVIFQILLFFYSLQEQKPMENLSLNIQTSFFVNFDPNQTGLMFILSADALPEYLEQPMNIDWDHILQTKDNILLFNEFKIDNKVRREKKFSDTELTEVFTTEAEVNKNIREIHKKVGNIFGIPFNYYIDKKIEVGTQNVPLKIDGQLVSSTYWGIRAMTFFYEEMSQDEIKNQSSKLAYLISGIPEIGAYFFELNAPVNGNKYALVPITYIGLPEGYRYAPIDNAPQ